MHQALAELGLRYLSYTPARITGLWWLPAQLGLSSTFLSCKRKIHFLEGSQGSSARTWVCCCNRNSGSSWCETPAGWQRAFPWGTRSSDTQHRFPSLATGISTRGRESLLTGKHINCWGLSESSCTASWALKNCRESLSNYGAAGSGGQQEATTGPWDCCGLTGNQDFTPVNPTAEASHAEQWLGKNNESTKTEPVPQSCLIPSCSPSFYW